MSVRIGRAEDVVHTPFRNMLEESSQQLLFALDGFQDPVAVVHPFVGRATVPYRVPGDLSTFVRQCSTRYLEIPTITKWSSPRILPSRVDKMLNGEYARAAPDRAPGIRPVKSGPEASQKCRLSNSEIAQTAAQSPTAKLVARERACRYERHCAGDPEPPCMRV